jgi:hypothetical protein
LPERKAHLSELEAELARYEATQKRLGLQFMPHHDERLRWLRETPRCST